MKVELAACTMTLLCDVFDKTLHQRDIAMTYALALQSSEETDWRTVNKAIVDRWSLSGLERIKNMAWSGKCFEKK